MVVALMVFMILIGLEILGETCVSEAGCLFPTANLLSDIFVSENLGNNGARGLIHFPRDEAIWVLAKNC